MSWMEKKRDNINKSFKYIDPRIPDLEFTDQETYYLSNPRDSVWRNRALRSLDVRHICDAYACVGGDTVQFMAIKPRAQIHAVQIQDGDRFQRLENNIAKCRFLNPTCYAHCDSIENYIKSGACALVDFMYCDPPWMKSDTEWYTCDELVENLHSEIAAPLSEAGCTPKYVCFKVPYEWETFNSVMDWFPSYTWMQSGTFHKKGYWIHIIAHKRMLFTNKT